MGGLPSKQDERLHHINKEVNSVRSSLRGSRRSLSKEIKEDLVQNLVQKSGEATALHGKVKQKKLDQTMKNISQTMNEVLTVTPRESQLDMEAVESNSFVQIPISKRRSFTSTDSVPSKKAKGSEENLSEPRKSKQNITKTTLPTLKDIEMKLNNLRPKIDYAVDAKDSKQLRFQEQTIKVLAGDLEMIHTDEGTILHEQKKKIEKQLTSNYQKVSRANKEIRRNNDVEYLSKRNKKESALKQLQQLDKNLQENESLLNWALENKEKETLLRIKENLVKNNQKLTEVELVDDHIKEEERRLTAKTIEVVKKIDESLNIHTFEKDISLAETKYQQLIDDIENHGSKEDSSKKLRNLKNFVKNLEPFNEDSKVKKENLFNLVERTLFNVISSLKKADVQKTVADIVEENVILRNKQKKDLMDLEKFYSHWRTVNDKFDVNSFSKDFLLKIDAILREMQMSIIELRKKIAVCNNCSPQNSTTKLGSFGSCQSLVDGTPEIIKVKTKYYNISSPELKHVDDQPPIDFYEFDSSVFSKIEEIKTQVYYLNEKISECQNTQHLKNKLESYIQILRKYLFHKNQTIANNAKIVTNDVNDILCDLSSKENIPSRRISIEDNFEDIVGIQETLEALEKEVQTFYGDRNNKNYERLKMALLECKGNLERIRISPRYEMVQQQKEELLKNCSSLVNILENRAANYSIYEENIIRERRNSLDKLKEKVDRFSGTYKGVLYNKIEMDLNKLLLQVNEGIDSKDVAEEIGKTAEKYLKILEQRSSKAQSFRNKISDEPKSSEQVNMIKIKNDLIGIKKEIDLTPDSNAQAFVRLKSRLDLVNLELDQIGTKSNEVLEKDKEIFANEAQTLKNYVEAKIALASQRPSQDLTKKTKIAFIKSDPIKDLKNIEEEFRLIKTEVSNFEDVHLDDKYFALDKRLNCLIAQLDKYSFIRGTDLNTQKSNLLKKMHQCKQELDKNEKVVKMLLKIETDLKTIDSNFEQEKSEKDLQEKLQNIKNSIEKLDIPTNLEKTKEEFLKKVISLLDRSNKDENISNDENDFTKIEEIFKTCKPDVDTFVGLRTDRRFVDLDECIIKLIVKLEKFELSKNSILNAKKSDLLRELHKYSSILDDRAKQTESVFELEQKLTEIDSLINNFSGSQDDRNFIKDKMHILQQRLNSTSVNNNLIERKNNCRQQFSIMFNKFSMLNPISKERTEKNYGYSSVVYNFTTNTKKELEKITKTLEQIKDDVEYFSNGETSDEYKAIDDVLTNVTSKLNKLDINRDNNLYDTKMALMEKIQNCTDILDEKAQEIQAIMEIEEELGNIDRTLSQDISEDVRNSIDEKLIQLQAKLGRLSVSENVFERKEQCSAKVLKLMKTLNEEKYKLDSFDFGTQI